MEVNTATVVSGDKSFQEPTNHEALSEIINSDYRAIHEPLLALHHAIKYPEMIDTMVGKATKLDIYQRMEQLEGMINQLFYDYCTKKNEHERHAFWLSHPERFKQDGDKWVFVKGGE
jgi:hypothetical protein